MTKNHTHAPFPDGATGFEPDNPERYAAAQKSTWISVSTNLALASLQLTAGYLGGSRSLMADGLHSLSDLLSDFLVLFANRQGSRHADAEHPYGHARIETAATLILGASLAALGVGLLIAAGIHLQDPARLRPVHILTLWVALGVLAAKEGLFRYMLAVAKRVRSQMLAANAWHARSDAASSLVVLIGIAGNLMGYTFLDLVASAVVGVMIAYMGGKLAFGALTELIDTGLSQGEVEAIRATLLGTPGVRGLHELRTRKMADSALVDAHIMVDPRISVSEGHFIAETVRLAVLRHHQVMDVMVHIDPEDDLKNAPNTDLPNRETLLRHLSEQLGCVLPERVMLHYLDGKIEAELFFETAPDGAECVVLQNKINKIIESDPWLRAVLLHCGCAQNMAK